jgi:predicted nucleotidyltransferase
MTPTLDDSRLREMAGALAAVPSVVGVTLGGSRARGDHTPESDVDLGLYYRHPLDVAALTALAREVTGSSAELSEPGEWGPWVDGGAWLTVDGVAVDWIYRDVDRVCNCWASARAGQFAFHQQIGHPFGVADFSYPGELALATLLADPTGELTALQSATRVYPAAMADALVAQCLWEASFLVAIAAKAVSRADAAYIAGCLFRVAVLCAHALHGRDRRWLVNEKGAIAAAGRLPSAPAGFAARAQELFGSLDATPASLANSLRRAEALIGVVGDACRS